VKLAIVCRPLSFHGGIETSTSGLIEELSRRGHAIDFLTSGAQPELSGARVRRLATIPQPSVLRILSFALAAARAVAHAGYDLVQSHERTLRQDVYRAGEGTHRGYLAAMGRAAGSRLQDRLLCALEARIFGLRSARHIVAIARAGKAEIERLFATPAERVTVVYNGVDLARFHPDNRERLGPAARQALGVDRGEWVILFVGSGFERKGLGPLIDALSRFGDRWWRLVVAGKGDARPYREQVERLGLGDRVTWLDPERQVERLYAAADVVALPARYEPFGNVHLEALATGVPVLTSRAAGGAELISQGRNGWVVPAPAPPDIALGLRALRDGDRAKLAGASRASAEPFTRGAQADALEALYRHLAR
jgi:UDP-glucose:(heptosyl)LPS alpha-1,3-glucosyltransferase